MVQSRQQTRKQSPKQYPKQFCKHCRGTGPFWATETPQQIGNMLPSKQHFITYDKCRNTIDIVRVESKFSRYLSATGLAVSRSATHCHNRVPNGISNLGTAPQPKWLGISRVRGCQSNFMPSSNSRASVGRIATNLKALLTSTQKINSATTSISRQRFRKPTWTTSWGHSG